MLGSFASLGLWLESITLPGSIFFKEENGFFVGVPQARSLPRSMLGSFASLGLWLESITLPGSIFFKEENGFFVGVPQARSLPRSMQTRPLG
jgi:hypothetical protein